MSVSPFWSSKVLRALGWFELGAAHGRHAGRLVADNAGATAVEFAIIALPFLLMLMEVLQSALFVYFAGQLDHATQSAARQILTGSMQNASLTASQFRTQLLCPLLPSVMSCNNVIVNLQTVSEAVAPNGFYTFVNASQTGLIIPPLDNTQTSFCPGSGGAYVYLQVFYAMPLLGNIWLPVTTTTFNGQTVKLIGSSAAFKNEPFQSGSNTPYPGC
jgi:Flp pilus assembly protein TadG